MLRRSSNRALSSTRQTACLPRSDASTSDATVPEGFPVRYTVAFSAADLESRDDETKRSTLVSYASYGW